MSGRDEPPLPWGGAEEASQPRLEPVHYRGPEDIRGDANTVARIHHTDRQFDLLETMVMAALASIVTIMSGLVGIYGPSDRSNTVLFMAISGWLLAAGLGGFAAFRITLSKSGLDVAADSAAPPAATRPRPAAKPK